MPPWPLTPPQSGTGCLPNKTPPVTVRHPLPSNGAAPVLVHLPPLPSVLAVPQPRFASASLIFGAPCARAFPLFSGRLGIPTPPRPSRSLASCHSLSLPARGSRRPTCWKRRGDAPAAAARAPLEPARAVLPARSECSFKAGRPLATGCSARRRLPALGLPRHTKGSREPARTSRAARRRGPAPPPAQPHTCRRPPRRPAPLLAEMPEPAPSPAQVEARSPAACLQRTEESWGAAARSEVWAGRALDTCAHSPAESDRTGGGAWAWASPLSPAEHPSHKGQGLS